MPSMEETVYEVLKALRREEGKASVEALVKATGLSHSSVMRAVLTLVEKGWAQTFERKQQVFTLTPEGSLYAENRLPERRLAETVVSLGGRALLEEAMEKAGVPSSAVSIASGWLVRKGWGHISRKDEEIELHVPVPPPEGEDERFLRQLKLEGELRSERLDPRQLKAAAELKRRKLVEERTSVLREIQLTEEGIRQLSLEPKPAAEETTLLTGELITSGRWREVKFREYDIAASPPKVYPGRKHFYMEFLEEVKRILLSMGFEEAEGPCVETEFWNFDVLFQPQDHPAREIHDSYQLKKPSRGSLGNEKLVRRIKKVHENGWVTGSTGWRYKWNPEVAKRLILRTQTTAVSVRFLAQHTKPPVKMFCLSQVFRPDVLDARHAMEFHQCDGIVMDRGLTFRHLLGFLEEIGKALGLGKLSFKPGYFPFTEPSVEAFVYHPKLGWVEAAGAGLFRPEVAKPLGAKYPVLAWGIGIGRLAMAKLGIDDIRELHSRRLEFLRERTL